MRLAAGRARACELMPYLGEALYAVQAVATPAVPTAGIDTRWRMYYNPEFLLTLDVAEVVGLWLHEVGHPLRAHAERFEALAEPRERHPLFNRAADCALNDDLRGAGIRLPAVRAWFPERVPGAASGMSAEQIYRLLLDSPAGRRLPDLPAVLLLPPELPAGRDVAARVLAHTREPFLTAPATAVLHAPGGEAAPVPVTVHDPRTASLDLPARLPPGEHTVEITCAGGGASAVLTVTRPTITLRPDHLRRDRGPSEKVVVAGRGTSFGAGSRVEFLAADGAPLHGAVHDVVHVGATYLTFRLGPVPDGTHLVRVTGGGQAVQAALPVGLPHLDVDPARLPGGFEPPTTLALTAEDVLLDATSAVEVLDPAAGLVPVDGATGPLVPVAPGAGNVQLTRPLREGRYLLAVTTAGERAVATLTVGTSGPAAAAGAGNTPAPAGADDCGSGAGGPRRPWELHDDGGGADGGAGGVDAGRAELIRRRTAHDVLEHARSRGSVPAGWQRWASTTLVPVVDWRRELASLTRRVGAHVAGMRDYSYARPSRRSATTPGVVLPAMRQPRPPRAAVVVDTSASVGEDMLARVHAETEAVIRRCHGTGVQVLACDAAATRARLVRRVRDVVMTGGGGTDMRVGIAAAAALRPRVDLVITATDGDTPWPERPPRENPGATYAVLLLDGDRDGVPRWMHRIVVERERPPGR
ncbi:hypothetical protein NUM3379_02280 [Kineococcus sp. NUM-3379]